MRSCSFTCKNARKPLIVAARVIDHVAELEDERLQDWEFQKKIRQFSDELYERIDFDRVMYNDFIEQETDKFLIEAGIDVSRRKPGGKAEEYDADQEVEG